MQWDCSTTNATSTNDHRVYASPDQWFGSCNGVLSACLVLAKNLEGRLGTLLIARGDAASFQRSDSRRLIGIVRTCGPGSISRAGFFPLHAFWQYAAAPGCVGAHRTVA